MKKNYAALLLLLLALTGCGAVSPEDETSQAPEPQTPELQTQEASPLDITVLEGRSGELDFAFSLEEWIPAFNRSYQEDQGIASYLRPAEEWRQESNATGIHSPWETICHVFVEDEAIWSLPAMTVYTPPEGERVQEITLDFDDHAYNDPAWELYMELCRSTVRTLLPSLEEGQVTELCETLNAVSYGELRLNKQRYERGIVPLVLYYKDGVGIYPHFALGDYVRLCVIPVTPETLENFRQQGTELRALP